MIAQINYIYYCGNKQSLLDWFKQEEGDGEEEEEEQKEEKENQEEEEENREEREAAYQAEVAYVERKLQALKSDPVHRCSLLTPHPPPTPRLPGV